MQRARCPLAPTARMAVPPWTSEELLFGFAFPLLFSRHNCQPKFEGDIMKSIAVNEEQLKKIKTSPGFIAALDQSGGSTPESAAALRNPRDAWSNEDEMFAIVHQMRTRIITSPSLTASGSLAPSCSRTPWTGKSRGSLPRLSLERETGGAVSESGPGPCGREGRRSVDEADARACRAARQSQSEAHLRNQDALGHQASQRSRHQGHREPAVRSRLGRSSPRT